MESELIFAPSEAHKLLKTKAASCATEIKWDQDLSKVETKACPLTLKKIREMIQSLETK